MSSDQNLSSPKAAEDEPLLDHLSSPERVWEVYQSAVEQLLEGKPLDQATARATEAAAAAYARGDESIASLQLQGSAENIAQTRENSHGAAQRTHIGNSDEHDAGVDTSKNLSARGSSIEDDKSTGTGKVNSNSSEAGGNEEAMFSNGHDLKSEAVAFLARIQQEDERASEIFQAKLESSGNESQSGEASKAWQQEFILSSLAEHPNQSFQNQERSHGSSTPNRAFDSLAAALATTRSALAQSSSSQNSLSLSQQNPTALSAVAQTSPQSSSQNYPSLSQQNPTAPKSYDSSALSASTNSTSSISSLISSVVPVSPKPFGDFPPTEAELEAAFKNHSAISMASSSVSSSLAPSLSSSFSSSSRILLPSFDKPRDSVSPGPSSGLQDNDSLWGDFDLSGMLREGQQRRVNQQNQRSVQRSQGTQEFQKQRERDRWAKSIVASLFSTISSAAAASAGGASSETQVSKNTNSTSSSPAKFPKSAKSRSDKKARPPLYQPKHASKHLPRHANGLEVSKRRLRHNSRLSGRLQSSKTSRLASKESAEPPRPSSSSAKQQSKGLDVEHLQRQQQLLQDLQLANQRALQWRAEGEQWKRRALAAEAKAERASMAEAAARDITSSLTERLRREVETASEKKDKQKQLEVREKENLRDRSELVRLRKRLVELKSRCTALELALGKEKASKKAADEQRVGAHRATIERMKKRLLAEQKSRKAADRKANAAHQEHVESQQQLQALAQASARYAALVAKQHLLARATNGAVVAAAAGLSPSLLPEHGKESFGAIRVDWDGSNTGEIGENSRLFGTLGLSSTAVDVSNFEDSSEEQTVLMEKAHFRDLPSTTSLQVPASLVGANRPASQK